MIGFSENCYFAEVEQLGKIVLSKYVNTKFCLFDLILLWKIVTGAKASKFKSMRFRNYCKFSCAYNGRARLRGPGNKDAGHSTFLRHAAGYVSCINYTTCIR
jgi:hypothetical protein